MGSVVGALFGGGAKGPDAELVKLQKQQAEAARKKEADEEKKLAARQQTLKAQSGQAGLGTAFAGEQGVTKDTLGG